MGCRWCEVLGARVLELNNRMDLDPWDEGLIEQRAELPRRFFDCDRCGTHLEVWAPGSDVSCDRCGASFNVFGQRLRDDWFANPAWRGEDVDDLEGFEVSQLLREGA